MTLSLRADKPEDVDERSVYYRRSSDRDSFDKEAILQKIRLSATSVFEALSLGACIDSQGIDRLLSQRRIFVLGAEPYSINN